MFVYIIKYDTHLLKAKNGSVVNITYHIMPKDYLQLTKDDRKKLLNIQKGKKTKKG